MKRKVLLLTICLLIAHIMGVKAQTGTTFTAKTIENWDIVFTILDESAKTCQVGYLDGSFDKPAINKEAVNGSLTIPNIVNGYTVVKIGKWALNNVDGMTSITIPNTVTSFDDYAFHSCDGFESFELPASVTTLGEGALSAFNRVTSMKVAGGNPKYDSRDNCNAIIETATNKIVAGCQTTIIPANATGIGTWAFSLSRGSIFIPSTITTIEENAFSCRNVTIQVERTTPLVINGNVFQGLGNSTLRVPAGCKSAYAAATGWKNFGTILEGNEGSTFTAKTTEGIDMVFTILDESAKTCQVGYLDGSWDKTAVDNDVVEGPVTIPGTVKGYTVAKIGKCAFEHVYKMTSVTIPNTVTSIDESAFNICYGLTSFELPASVTSLGNAALSGFSTATSLEVAENNPKYDSRDNCNAIIEKATNKLLFGCNNTKIPVSVTEIGDYAFFSLNNIVLEVEHTTPLQINENIFQNLQNSTLRVPAGCKSTYAAATGWNKFSTILEGNEGATITAKTIENWDMVFTILDDNEKTCQVGYINGSQNKLAVDKDVVEGSVTIPETVEGYTVVKIGKAALHNVYKMTSVKIPNTVTAIEEHALSNTALTSFELPASVTYLGSHALSSFNNATSVKVVEGNPKYDSRYNCNAIIETATNKLLFGCKNTIIPSTVTEIGREAFAGLLNSTLVIPSTITKIGEFAFSYCPNLTLQVEHTTPLTINENVFEGLSNSTLRVPAGCKSAYAEATGWSKFGADNIVEVTGELINVTTAGTLSSFISDEDKFNITDLTITGQLNGTDFRLLRAMAGNDYTGHPTNGKLQKLDLSGVTIVEGGNTYYESDGIYRVDDSMAAGKGSKSLSTEKNVVGPFLFAGCTQLSEVKIPSNTKEIGDWAFMMTNISALDIPDGVVKMWPSFSYDTRVSTITIPETVTDIVASVAQINSSLSSIIVDSDNSKYDSRNNCNAIMETSTNTLVLGCKNTIIPNDTKIIGSYAFSGDTGESITLPQGLQTIGQYAFNSSSIKNIAIPASVSHIGDNAFVSCYNLATITVDAGNETYESPEGSNAIITKSTKTLIAGCKSTIIPSDVKAIGAYVFNSCNSLASITIPASIESIGDYAFGYCNNLTSVTVEAIEPLAINETVFSGTNTNATLYVPAGSKAAYQAADGWKDFNTILEGNEGSTFTAKTTENIDMVFTILDESAKTCQVGYLDGSWDKTAVDIESVKGPVTIPETVNGYTVVKIGKCALQSVNGMTSVTIPNTVTSIDEYAFADCQGLTSFVLPASVTSLGSIALYDLKNVTSLSVAEGNTIFDSRNNCNAIIETSTNKLIAGCQTTKIPADVIEIGSDALCLQDCSFFVPSTITKINEYAFSNCRNLILQVAHSTPLEINENVFNHLSNSTLRVPAGSKAAYTATTGWKKFDTIMEGNEGSTFTATTAENIDMIFTILGESAKTCQVGYLNGAWNKTAVDKESVEGSLTIPETVNGYTVVKIGKYALYNTYKMTSVTIPNTVTAIDEYAFSDCGLLASFELPASVLTLGEYALRGSYVYTSIKVAEGNTKYDSRNNCNAIIETASNKLLQGCKNTIIPASVTEIGDYAFSLTNCIFVLPSTINKINDYAFSGLYNVVLQVAHTSPLDINENVFNQLSNSTLRVPAGCKSAYAAATGWSKFGADNIVEEIKISINVETAGTLSSKISDEDKFTITDLTITGQLNGTDFRLLRAMAGNDYTGHPTEGKLEKLDLSGATIVEGGDPYFVSDGIYRANGSKAAGRGSNKSLSTENYVVGPFLFAGCAQLSEVKIPSNTEEIGDWAFMMTNISALDIPDGVVKMWPSFSSETRVSTITIPKTVTNIVGSWGQINPYLSSIIVDPDNSKYDSRNNCNAIMEISTNTLVLGCKNTIIPDNTEIIGSYAFSGDTGESITLPQGLQTIGQDAFTGSSINNIAIPASVSQIEHDAFKNCNNLATITVDALNETYESPEGSNAIIKKSSKTLMVGCKSTIIPSDVTSIGVSAFYNNNGLTSITLPASIESIGDYAFGYCNNLTSVTVEAVEPLAINETVFSGTNTNATLYVPAGSKAKYKAATGWKDFNEIIETISVFSGTNLWAGYVAVENFALPTGLKAYVITSLDATTATASPLDYIPQGVPVLLKRENTSDNNFEMSAGSGTAPTVNLLRTYESAKNVSNREGFILYNDEFVLVNEGTLPAGRVFLPANKSGVALTRGIVTGGDDTTGIYNSKMDFDDSDKQWYDLQGRKLERKPTKKGIYILDGRKVVIK